MNTAKGRGYEDQAISPLPGIGLRDGARQRKRPDQ